ARVTAAGALLDPTGFLIYAGPNDDGVTAVGCNTTQRCLVAWAEAPIGSFTSNATRYMLVDTAAAAPLPATLTTTAAGGKPAYVGAVGWAGTQFIALWAQTGTGGSSDVRGSRVDATTGALKDNPGFAVGITTDTEGGPAIDCAGTNCVVAWYHYS